MKRSPTPSSAAKAIANNKNFPLEILLKVPAAAAEAIASDEDLLREILLRLPAKHLIRSKCVSKQWLSLISSSEFCRSHVRRHNTSLKAAALFFECGPYHVQPAGFHMVPLNNQCSKALPLDFASEVRIKQSCNGSNFHWKKPKLEGFALGHFCNGAIHWNPRATPWGPWDPWASDSISWYFHVENECINKMAMPGWNYMAPHESAIESSRYLGESCGHLHLGVAYEPPYFHCNIFEMASNFTWFLKFRLNLETVVEAFPEIDLTSESSKCFVCYTI